MIIFLWLSTQTDSPGLRLNQRSAPHLFRSPLSTGVACEMMVLSFKNVDRWLSSTQQHFPSEGPDLQAQPQNECIRSSDGGKLGGSRVPEEEIGSHSQDEPEALRMACHCAMDISLPSASHSIDRPSSGYRISTVITGKAIP